MTSDSPRGKSFTLQNCWSSNVSPSKKGNCYSNLPPSMGHGVFHYKAFVKMLNTKSSTGAELVGVSKYLPYNLWIIFFCMRSDM